ncbi:hypothetical protein AOLI_G00251400 [Acnodon oligacanthus]
MEAWRKQRQRPPFSPPHRPPPLSVPSPPPLLPLRRCESLSVQHRGQRPALFPLEVTKRGRRLRELSGRRGAAEKRLHLLRAGAVVSQPKPCLRREERRAGTSHSAGDSRWLLGRVTPDSPSVPQLQPHFGNVARSQTGAKRLKSRGGPHFPPPLSSGGSSRPLSAPVPRL